MTSASPATPPSPHPTPDAPSILATSSLQSGKARHCRFYSSKAGCRAGNSCEFIHNESLRPSVHGPQTFAPLTNSQNGAQAVQIPAAARVVPRPVPPAQLQNPREFQLGQIRRRYKPKETHGPDKSAMLALRIAPSDPDFPFEMAILSCVLIVPTDYPKSRPVIKVENSDIPRGFAINIEKGFDGLAGNKEATLLSLITALDRNLEVFLSEKKAETVKLVANADKRHIIHGQANERGRVVASTNSTLHQPPQPTTSNQPVSKQDPIFSSEDKREAQETREIETRQLEARLGRIPLFKKASDGFAYTLPIEPRRRAELPSALQSLKTITVFVPLLYPLQPCRVQIDGVDSPESRAAQAAFAERAKDVNDTSLLSHINHFAQNLHVMAKKIEVLELDTKPKDASNLIAEQPKSSLVEEHDKGHIQVIPRPPEWDRNNSDDSESYDDSYDSGDESSDIGGIELGSEGNAKGDAVSTNPERGTAISFPFIELYGIELLEVATLNLSVRCERCKEPSDISLKDSLSKTESCRKCATQLTVTFRRDLIHAHAVRAGFLDLSGCTPLDMLPSNFVPTCATCSTAYPSPGIVSVRGETISNVCRECHSKFTFSLPEVKFLRISTTHIPAATGPRRKRETLGLVAGTELPRRGRCKHYSKSLRWFRFSCCLKVFPCDLCHDEVEEHANEHANRMICGYCSREQNFRPEDCAVCHGVLVGKKGSGFWEGGKGTRDRVRMSRKDKRKFRRTPREGGGASSGTAGKK